LERSCLRNSSPEKKSQFIAGGGRGNRVGLEGPTGKSCDEKTPTGKTRGGKIRRGYKEKKAKKNEWEVSDHWEKVTGSLRNTWKAE